MNAAPAFLWRQASLPAVEPGFQPGGTSLGQPELYRVFGSCGTRTVLLSLWQDATLHGRQDACRYAS
jgi:hypothetical protein